MDVLTHHYPQSAGMKSNCHISHVQMDALTLPLWFVGSCVVCPECGIECSMKGHAAERSCRHLDVMKFQTKLNDRISRCSCNQCAANTKPVPWAEKHNHFTLFFGAFVTDVLQAVRSTQAAAMLLRIDWSTAFFESWHAWSIRSRLNPIKKIARLLKNPSDRIRM